METEGLDRNLLAVVPMSVDVVRWNKKLLLEEIKSEVSNGSVSESILDNLENLEALERSQGNPIPDSMRVVYCMVALECTVRFLVSTGGIPRDNYSKALNRIWRDRIARLESLGTSQLLSDELKKQRDELYSVFDNRDVSTKLCRMNTRNDALLSICVYLEKEEEADDSILVDKNKQLHDDVLVEPTLNKLGKDGGSRFSDGISLIPFGKEGNATTVSKRNPSKVASPSLMGHDKTSTPTREWDKSIDDSPKANANQPPIPKRETVSPPLKMRKIETKIRRKNKRWSLHEEEILRNAVQKFGTSWKYILVVHRIDFEDRTVVDLKDKWRNMTKNLHR